MTRKKLPKAITRTGVIRPEPRSEPRGAAAAAASEQRKKGPQARSSPKPAPPEEEEVAAPEPNPEPYPKPIPQSRKAAADPVHEADAPPLSGEVIPPGSVEPEPPQQRQRAVAEKIVERYKLYAAVGGLFPVPALNVAGVTAINVRMVKMLSDVYGVPFQQNQTRSMIVGLMGGSVPTGLGFATASTLALVVPGAGFVGLAVSTLTAAALTRSIGLLFIDHFESGAASPAAANGNPRG